MSTNIFRNHVSCMEPTHYSVSDYNCLKSQQINREVISHHVLCFQKVMRNFLKSVSLLDTEVDITGKNLSVVLW